MASRTFESHAYNQHREVVYEITSNLWVTSPKAGKAALYVDVTQRQSCPYYATWKLCGDSSLDRSSLMTYHLRRAQAANGQCSCGRRSSARQLGWRRDIVYGRVAVAGQTCCTSSRWRYRDRWLQGSLFSVPSDCVSKPALDASRQLILPFGADEGIFASHLEIAVAGDLRCLDRASADLLPPCNIGAAKRVRT
jgi:hypothetical protein